MAKRSFMMTSNTPTATADTTNLVDATYPGVLQGGSATQRVNILEVTITGQSAASTPTFNVLSRDSQVGTGSATLSTGATDAALDAATAALAAPVVVANQFATNKPQRSSTLHLLNISINGFGGLFRWVAAPGEEISLVGATASLGEISLSAFSGGTPGAQGSHIIYEPL